MDNFKTEKGLELEYAGAIDEIKKLVKENPILKEIDDKVFKEQLNHAIKRNEKLEEELKFQEFSGDKLNPDSQYIIKTQHKSGGVPLLKLFYVTNPKNADVINEITQPDCDDRIWCIDLKLNRIYKVEEENVGYECDDYEIYIDDTDYEIVTGIWELSLADMRKNYRKEVV